MESQGPARTAFRPAPAGCCRPWSVHHLTRCLATSCTPPEGQERDGTAECGGTQSYVEKINYHMIRKDQM